MIVYIVLPYDEWRSFAATGARPPYDFTYVYHHRQVDGWVKRRLAERTGLEPGEVFPTYASLSRPPSYHMWPPKRAVLKVRVPEEHVVPFDDRGFIRMLNTIGNGEEEGDEASRMFDVGGCPPDELRAFVATPVTRQMVRKAWVYRWGARLRRGGRPRNAASGIPSSLSRP